MVGEGVVFQGMRGYTVPPHAPAVVCFTMSVTQHIWLKKKYYSVPIFNPVVSEATRLSTWLWNPCCLCVYWTFLFSRPYSIASTETANLAAQPECIANSRIVPQQLISMKTVPRESLCSLLGEEQRGRCPEVITGACPSSTR